jgi:hypothetical protein
VIGTNLWACILPLPYPNLGRIRKPEPDELVNQAGCLNPMTHAIVVWSAVYMQIAIDAQQPEGIHSMVKLLATFRLFVLNISTLMTDLSSSSE